MDAFGVYREAFGMIALPYPDEIGVLFYPP